MKYDLHIHTHHSACANLKPETILKFAKKKGLDGIAVTDHNTIKGSLEVSNLNKNKDFEVIKSAEIGTNYGDVLVYYIQEEVKSRNLFEVFDEVKQQGGLIAIAHPFRTGDRFKFRYSLNKIEGKIDAIETFNSRMLPGNNEKAQEAASRLGLSQVGGSDAHFWFDVGRGYTLFEGELREAIKNKKTKVGGSILLAPIGGVLSVIEKKIVKKLE